MPNDTSDNYLDQFLNEAAIHCDHADTEAEALFNLLSAVDHLRPSIIIGICRNTRSTQHFIECVRIALMASREPSMADFFAGQAVDTFNCKEASKADAVYRLIMLAASFTEILNFELSDALSQARRVYSLTKPEAGDA